jgi:predicted TIM-barrel fold metal-dependent hydrolase
VSVAIRAPAGVRAVDALVYAGPSRFGGGRTLDELHADARQLGLEGLVVAPARPPDQDLARASGELARGCARTGDRALARLDPWDDRATAMLADLVEESGVAGLLLHPWEETFSANHPRAIALARAAAEAGLTVVVEAGHPLLGEALAVAELARAVAPAPVVGTRALQLNMSGLGQRSADLALESAPNLHLHGAGMYRQDWLERTIETVGAGRVLFASLAPVFDQRLELARLLEAPLSDDERQQVLGGNAMRLFPDRAGGRAIQ